VNKLMIIGNLVRDPESRSLPSGVNLCTFTVAVNGRKDEVSFFRVTTWRGLAENCQRFLSKGKKVAVAGSVKLTTYTTKEGNQGASMEVNADEVEFLTPRSDADDSGLTYPPPKDKQSGMTIVEADDDLPF